MKTGEIKLSEFVDATVNDMVKFYRQPRKQAFAIGVVLTAVLTASRDYSFVPGVLLNIAGGLVAEHAYLAAANLRTLAESARNETRLHQA